MKHLQMVSLSVLNNIENKMWLMLFPEKKKSKYSLTYSPCIDDDKNNP